MDILTNSLITKTYFTNNIIESLVGLIVTIIVVVLIWLIGNWLLGVLLKIVTKLNIPGTKLDDKIVEKFRPLISIVWKILLVIVILEYVGVGGFIINAFLGAISFTIAIALGLSIGDALKPYAKDTVDKIAKEYKK